MLEEARTLFLQQQNESAQKLADAYMDSFDCRNLYNQLARLKRGSEGGRVILSADGEIPYNVVVKVMDTLQVFLEHDHYETDAAFESAEIRDKHRNQEALLDIQMLAPPRLESDL